MLEFGWFTTGRDQAARQLLEVVLSQIKDGEIRGHIQFVFVSREPGESPESDKLISLATSHNLPVITFSFNRFREKALRTAPAISQDWPEWRTEYDREVARRLKDYSPDICVMAGYMLILSPEMCYRFNFINLHPAVPNGPTGTWQEVIWKLIETEATHAGAMMHLVTPELDRGPAVTFFKFPIRGGEFDIAWEEIKGRKVSEIRSQEGERNRLFRLIRQEELAREFPLITTTLRIMSEGRVAIREHKVVNSRGEPTAPYDLSEEIEKSLKARRG